MRKQLKLPGNATVERPITIPGPEDVRKILSGEKTQARRILSPQPVCDPEFLGGWTWKTSHADTSVRSINEGKHPEVEVCPFGSVRDLLWVRETFAIGLRMNGRDVERDADGDPNLPGVWYGADPDNEDLMWEQENGETNFEIPWEPPIRMQRWASRILLEIVSVRVERLQDITEEGAKAEGAVIGPSSCPDAGQTSYRRAFAFSWNQINSRRGSWKENPFVWRVQFRSLG